MHTTNKTTAAFQFVLLIGLLSFFADFTYEGSRSIVGPYLALLQASGTAVAIVSGFGELLGYGLRLISGPLADRTGSALIDFLYDRSISAVVHFASARNWLQSRVSFWFGAKPWRPGDARNGRPDVGFSIPYSSAPKLNILLYKSSP